MNIKGPISRLYQKYAKKEKLKSDPLQKSALLALDRLAKNLLKNSKWDKIKSLIYRNDLTKGVYLYGKPGGGKSLLMDMFIEGLNKLNININVRRVHFHSFMIGIHNLIKKNNQLRMKDPINLVGKKISKNTKVLCFDEFEVLDIADAMILSRLFESLINNGIIIIITSNYAPDNLYKDGLQRIRFLGFIKFLKNKMEIIKIANHLDYRINKNYNSYNDLYFYPLSQKSTNKLDLLFDRISGRHKERNSDISTKGKQLKYTRISREAVLINFESLCGMNYSARDYILLAEKFEWILIDNIPIMTDDLLNEIRRFMILIDILYEGKIGLGIAAETKPDKICISKKYIKPFARTSSRIEEMRQAYWRFDKLT